MRNRTLFAVALVATLPSTLCAQFVGGTRRPGVQGTAEPERTPEPIARSMAIQRSRVSFESYPIVNFVPASSLAPGYLGKGYTSLGTGLHVEWRGTSSLLAAADYTASYLGAPALTQTLELGGRYRPGNWDHAFRPYVDVRGAYMQSGGEYTSQTALTSPFGLPPTPSLGMQYSRGYGGVAGAGGEFWFATRFAVTGGVDAVRSHMTQYGHTGQSTLPENPQYWMNSYRITLGLKFNQAQATSGLRQPR